MQEFTVKYDFTKFQPRWVGDLPRIFGERNEGVPVTAETADAARKAFAAEKNLNPFYLKAE